MDREISDLRDLGVVTYPPTWGFYPAQHSFLLSGFRYAGEAPLAPEDLPQYLHLV